MSCFSILLYLALEFRWTSGYYQWKGNFFYRTIGVNYFLGTYANSWTDFSLIAKTVTTDIPHQTCVICFLIIAIRFFLQNKDCETTKVREKIIAFWVAFYALEESYVPSACVQLSMPVSDSHWVQPCNLSQSKNLQFLQPLIYSQYLTEKSVRFAVNGVS